MKRMPPTIQLHRYGSSAAVAETVLELLEHYLRDQPVESQRQDRRWSTSGDSEVASATASTTPHSSAAKAANAR